MANKSDLVSGVEASAAKILTRAIDMEQNAKYQTSLVCYQEGIDLLLEVLKGLPFATIKQHKPHGQTPLADANTAVKMFLQENGIYQVSCVDQEKKKHYRIKIEEYMTRAEKVKTLVNKLKQEGKYHEQTKIDENASGFGYLTVFGPYLEESITEVWIDDAYIRSFHQINNFLRFCELLVGHCKSLKAIHLTTSLDEHGNSQQEQSLHCIGRSLSLRGITLHVSYNSALHDREIRFSNGWIIKVGRGLDYFKRVEKFCIGFHDFNLRPCHATTIDVFHSKHTRER